MVAAMTAPEFRYRLLTTIDQQKLRLERIRLIEADLYRASLQFEEALSDEERRNVQQEIDALLARLKPHYQTLGLITNDAIPKEE
jgi:hypothetical protein